METVTLSWLRHRHKDCIGIFFKVSQHLSHLVRQLRDARWSRQNNCWYIPLSKEGYDQIITVLRGITNIDNQPLKEYLEKRKKILDGPLPLIVSSAAPQSIRKSTAVPVVPASLLSLSPENLQALEAFIQTLTLKAYSLSTIKTYRSEFLQLLQLLKNKPADSLTAGDLKRYMVYTMEKQKISENTAHSRLNALKFYFEQVLKKEKFFWEIPRPKKALQLPKLLNEEEIRRLFNALTNKKHKAMLFTAYSPRRFKK